MKKLEQKIRQLLIQAELDFEKEKLAIVKERTDNPMMAAIDQDSLNALWLTAGKVYTLQALVLYIDKELEASIIRNTWKTLFSGKQS